MTHPTNEQLLDLLYHELEPASAETIAAHVRECAQCQTQLASWRGVRTELAAWDLPETTSTTPASFAASLTTPRTTWLRRTLTAAAAAVLLVGTGYGLARFNTPAPVAPVATAAVNTAELRAQITRELRDELGKELAARHLQFAKQMRESQQDLRQAVGASLDELERRELVRNAALRRDVETLAVHAQKEINQIAYAARPEEPPTDLRDQ